MKACIPTTGKGGLDGNVSEHFGRAESYTIVDLDSMGCEVLTNDGEHVCRSAGAQRDISSTGAKVVICSGLGQRALQTLWANGFTVYIGAKGTARQAVDMFKNGSLAQATQDAACRHHHDHDEHHAFGTGVKP